MKSVMVSIRPKWCELIASGQKTIEVRKTAPKEVPFKAYIYCTNDRKVMLERSNYDKSIYLNGNIYYPHKVDISLNGKIIGEFICDKNVKYLYEPCNDGEHLLPYGELEKMCLDGIQLYDYLRCKDGYGWHISDLVIYDKPKELSEFFKYCGDEPNCENCGFYYLESNENGTYEECCSPMECFKPLNRPPQSWMYVEVDE